MESGYTYPERSDNKLTRVCANTEMTNHYSDVMRYYQKSAEVIVDWTRSHLKKKKRWKHSHKIEVLNVRVGERTTPVYQVGISQPNHISELLI